MMRCQPLSLLLGRSEAMVTLPPEDIKIEVYPIPGIHQKGGQHVGVQNGVRITHSSGVAAYVDNSRSRHINKMIAEEMILAAITHPRFRP